MTSYITIKKKTLYKSLLSIVIIVLACLATWTIYTYCTKKEQKVRMVETESRNVLMSGSREVAYFNRIDSDSTFTGLTIYEDSVKMAPVLHLSQQDITNIIRHTTKKQEATIEYLQAAQKEMKYYLDTHGVQDEGYDMIANYQHTIQLQIELQQRLLSALQAVCEESHLNVKHKVKEVPEDEQIPSSIFIATEKGRWINGRWTKTKWQTKGITYDLQGNIVCGIWNGDTLIAGRKIDADGVYNGELNSVGMANGHGSYQANDGNYYEGHWDANQRSGFGFSINNHKLRAGEWKKNHYQGEKLHYTSERIYGIDISKYQHGKGKKHYPIFWNRLRISHLGHISKKTVSGQVNYPISFVYIKSTEGTSVRNPYYPSDYRQAHKYGYRTGAYHFFSIRSNPAVQARFFLKYSAFKRGDMPPVLDVEPTNEQIKKMGGAKVLFQHIRIWLNIVKRQTGVKPVLYVSQQFVNRYLNMAPDIKQNYNIWIARYGEYKPDVKLVYWQLCPDGRVNGIRGEVDINVFNGYKDKFADFIKTETIK